MREPLMLVLLVGVGCDASAPPRDAGADLPLVVLDPEIECGDQTCGPHEACYRACCDGAAFRCYARPATGCLETDLPMLACNGVLGACQCVGTHPCPAAPPCTEPLRPQCVPLPASCTDACCDPWACALTGGTCDPVRREVTCFCPTPDMG